MTKLIGREFYKDGFRYTVSGLLGTLYQVSVVDLQGPDDPTSDLIIWLTYRKLKAMMTESK